MTRSPFGSHEDPNRIPNPYTCGACPFVTDTWEVARDHRAQHATAARVFIEWFVMIEKEVAA